MTTEQININRLIEHIAKRPTLTLWPAEMTYIRFALAYEKWLSELDELKAEVASQLAPTEGTNVNGISIQGIEIQIDKSGVGHCWVAADSIDCPADIAEEIAAEILDGNNECDDYVASNGVHYRW